MALKPGCFFYRGKMTAQELVTAAILKATGEVFTGTWGDNDSTKMLAIANARIDDWRDEPGVKWESLYDPGYSNGTVSATNTFDLDDEIYQLSNAHGDYIYIENTDGTVTYYRTVAASKLKNYTSGNYCARAGRTLRFNRTFTSTDREYGGVLYIPCYLAPAHLVSANDTVPIDNPNWLVTSAAAEWCRNDITLSQNYPNLIAEANNLMASMKAANAPQVSDVALYSAGGGRDW